MKGKYREYILISILTLGVLLSSCDREESAYAKSIEGHWIYTETKAEVYVTDPSLKKTIEDYINNRYKAYKVSYEFKNDKTYYYYKNYAEPLKGIYKTIDKNYFTMDDKQGIKTLSCKDSVIYIVSDIKDEVVQELKIDKNKILKANTMDIFERGLFTH
ncbi:hypothetical protein [Dysgonomonas termitidis]|uniref:Lipocalin-like domain-containing protein n=1 Tax=Dysgonomonas termitidis TaxID=1516126 RepID=A0ABV9KQC6_9BACT